MAKALAVEFTTPTAANYKGGHKNPNVQQNDDRLGRAPAGDAADHVQAKKGRQAAAECRAAACEAGGRRAEAAVSAADLDRRAWNLGQARGEMTEPKGQLSQIKGALA